MDAGLYESDDFLVYAPGAAAILKAGDGDNDRRIGGYASTESLDRQQEQVLQKGLDFTEFTQHGYYNDNHKQDTAAVVGIPELARFDAGQGWYTEGHLLKGYDPAERIWKLATALHGTSRSLGFSIEGKIERREGNRIVKARVRHVAITNSPVNTDCTWGILAKSFCQHPSAAECADACCIVHKAMTVGAVKGKGGLVLVPEDLEHDEVTHIHSCPKRKCRKAFSTERGLDEHMAKAHGTTVAKSAEPGETIRRPASALSREDAIERVKLLRPHLSDFAATRVVDYVLSLTP
jgi:hypothetical protein